MIIKTRYIIILTLLSSNSINIYTSDDALTIKRLLLERYMIYRGDKNNVCKAFIDLPWQCDNHCHTCGKQVDKIIFNYTIGRYIIIHIGDKI